MQRGHRSVSNRVHGPWAVVAGLLGAALLALVPSAPERASAFTGASVDPNPALTTPAPAEISPAPSTAPAAQPTDPAAVPTTPAADPTPSADPSASAGTSPAPGPGPTAPASDGPAPVTPSPTVAPAPSGRPAPAPAPVATGSGVAIDHYVLGVIASPASDPGYLAADTPVPDATRLDTVRVRFRLHNLSGADATVTPLLEFRRAGTTRFQAVPEKPTPDIALNLTQEWRRTAGGRSVQSPAAAGIPVAELMLGGGASTPGLAGNRSMAANPVQQVTLPPDGWTEQEFTVRVSVDATYATDYELRVSDAGGRTQVTGVTAVLGLGAAPAERLSPGQRTGVDVRERPSTRTGTGIAYPLISTAAARRTLATGYSQAAGATAFAAAIPAAPNATDSIHGPYSMTSDTCASCHRGHTAPGPNLLSTVTPTSTLCLTCHDSLGASSGASDVAGQYADPSVPQNNATAREYYRHDATVTSSHTLAQEDEFGGVSNRHADCADCHNPHRATDTSIPPDPANNSYAGGWPASGRQAGISGVAVINGAAGTSPTYTFADGVNQPITLEYQLCFKCHSGYTVLQSNTGVSPSKYALDKAIEFNPANASFHPVEAAGTNQTAKMAASLAGTSPYKLWNFSTTGTVRCSSCHANGTSAAGTPTPGAGSDLPAHTSTYRGLLLRNYRDRTLLSSNEPYSASNFALCLVCHAETPFLNETSTATNFRYHGLHLAGLAGKGNGGTDIDTAGAGQGNAVCAECHFRLHSTTFRTGNQVVPGTRLVNFAPNVQGSGTTSPTWVKTATGGSCTLTCHGERHSSFNY